MTHLPRLLLAATCLVFGVTAFAADTAYLAKVNGVAIPTSALDQALAVARASGQTDTPALRTLLTQRLIADELFWQEAQKLNLQNSPESHRRSRSGASPKCHRSIRSAERQAVHAK